MARSGDMDIVWNQETLDGILRSPKVVEATREVAQRGLDAARASAPEDSGDYRRALHLERRESRYRTVWRVVGGDAKTLLIESKLGVLARALKSLSRRRG